MKSRNAPQSSSKELAKAKEVEAKNKAEVASS